MKLELPPKPGRDISGRLRDAADLGEIVWDRDGLGMRDPLNPGRDCG